MQVGVCHITFLGTKLYLSYSSELELIQKLSVELSSCCGDIKKWTMGGELAEGPDTVLISIYRRICLPRR
jgi:hypothetical protein